MSRLAVRLSHSWLSVIALLVVCLAATILQPAPRSEAFVGPAGGVLVQLAGF